MNLYTLIPLLLVKAHGLDKGISPEKTLNSLSLIHWNLLEQAYYQFHGLPVPAILQHLYDNNLSIALQVDKNPDRYRDHEEVQRFIETDLTKRLHLKIYPHHSKLITDKYGYILYFTGVLGEFPSAKKKSWGYKFKSHPSDDMTGSAFRREYMDRALNQLNYFDLHQSLLDDARIMYDLFYGDYAQNQWDWFPEMGDSFPRPGESWSKSKEYYETKLRRWESGFNRWLEFTFPDKSLGNRLYAVQQLLSTYRDHEQTDLSDWREEMIPIYKLLLSEITE